jgi:hypothetical protein
MKIAQIAPLMESVPPRLYGGTERIVSYLTEELVRLGHEVTLFASADSLTAARLVSCAPTALRLDSNVRDPPFEANGPLNWPLRCERVVSGNAWLSRV